MTKVANYQLLTEAADYFKLARKNVYAGAALLYEIEQTSAWEGKYSSFSEYVEQECQISRGSASKLLQVWKFYVIDRGASRKSLEGVDSEKLYLASKLPTEALVNGERKVVDLITIAREWNRQDLRAELSTVNGEECAHPEASQVTICGICHSRLS